MSGEPSTGLDRLFLDANVLFSAAYKIDTPMRRFWSLPNVELITSTHVANEARRNLSTDEQRLNLASLIGTMHVVAYEPAPGDLQLVGLSVAKKDEPILLAAIDLSATHLITGDKKHFRHLYFHRIHGVLILPPVEY